MCFKLTTFFWFVWLLHNKKYIIFPPFQLAECLHKTAIPWLSLGKSLNVILYFQLNFPDKACLVKNKMTICNVKKKNALGKNVSGFPNHNKFHIAKEFHNYNVAYPQIVGCANIVLHFSEIKTKKDFLRKFNWINMLWHENIKYIPGMFDFH